MNARINRHGLQVAQVLDSFVSDQVLPGTGVDLETLWRGFASLIKELAPENRALLKKRDDFQQAIDRWYRGNSGATDPVAQEKFLNDIGYIVPEGPDFQITTANVDAEIAHIPGPQLVVPVMNARYALNAANARWGSLYDALYGSDVIAEKDPTERAQRVIGWCREFLDLHFPLADGNWTSLSALPGGPTAFRDGAQFVGLRQISTTSRSILLRHHGLHVEVVADSAVTLAAKDRAGISDLRIEAALTTIMDCEDSVAAVDAEDKVKVYENWLGLMRADLTESLNKNGRQITRALNPDLEYSAADGTPGVLRARSLMLVRNVGHLMTTPAILDETGAEIPEGLMDAMFTALAAMHDIGPKGRKANSATGSMYVVKPKMHGPDEVAFAVKTFDRVENILGLAANTVKLGIMDEERRTTLNLKECIRAAKSRVVFINTGFLDRTGDEIHTSMEAGPMIRKGDMKQSTWIKAYEDWNVDKGLAAGFSGRAQIGKGMWAMPDLMAAMLEQKIAHPKSAANTAWVPSPTGAALHATHYHTVDVLTLQSKLQGVKRAKRSDILSIPVAVRPNWTAQDIQHEIDNNAQGLLGYVVRWVDQGIGCSKVPDINNVGLMEDRATLRISSQHLANWLRHGMVTVQQMQETLQRMARVVDAQNQDDPAYRPMADNFASSIAFQTACELVFKGHEQPNGYTEPLLHAARLRVKQGQQL